MRALFLIVVMLAGLAAAITLVARPTMSTRARRQLFTLAVLGTLMPYAIHGLQVYESLTTTAPGSGLAIGIYPILDRWFAFLLLVIVLLALTGWWAARTRPVAAVLIPVVMAVAYLTGFLPYALGNRPSGTSPSAPPRSWLIWAMVVGVMVMAVAARRAPAIDNQSPATRI